MTFAISSVPSAADYAIVAVMALALVPSVAALALRLLPALRRLQPGLNRVRRWVLITEATLVPVAIAALWAWHQRPPDMLGLGLPTSTPALVALGLGIAWSMGIAVYCWSDVRHTRTCEDCRRDWHEDTLKTYGRSPAELRRFPPYVGALQAVVEEVIFRAFLIWVLTPGLGVVGAVIAAAICFGAMHAASLRWAIFATCVGLVLGTVYALTESLWGMMIAHAAQNLSVFLHHRALAAMPAPARTSPAPTSEAPAG